MKVNSHLRPSDPIGTQLLKITILSRSRFEYVKIDSMATRQMLRSAMAMIVRDLVVQLIP